MYIKIQVSVGKRWHKSGTEVATLAKHVAEEYSP